MNKREPLRGHRTAEGAGTSVSVQLQDDGVVRLELPPGQPITERIASLAAADVASLADGKKVRVLLSLAGVESISREARDVFGSVPGLAAVAVLGAGPVDKVIATFLLGGGVRPPFPTRYFSSEDKARDWLEEHSA